MWWKSFVLIFFVSVFGLGFFFQKGPKHVPSKQMTEIPAFLSFCEEAAKDPEVFKKFKQNPIYALFHDNGTFEEGRYFLKRMKKNFPEFLDPTLLEKVRTIDCIGSPKIHDFGSVGPFSPSTLHYLKIAADLKSQFGKLENARIIEIGGESGALCKVLHEVLDVERYVIVNLKEPLALIQKHLGKLGLKHVQYVTPDELKLEPSDLLISTHGFSESSSPLQKRYMRKLFSGAKHGFVYCRFYPKQFQLMSMKKDLLLKRAKRCCRNISLLPEDPPTGSENFILTWNQG